MQNGVLKALSFLFEYIGEMGKDYIYAGEEDFYFYFVVDFVVVVDL